MSVRFGKKLNIIILASVLLIIAIITYQSMNINYKVENGMVKINWFAGVDIPIRDITEINVLNKIPNMTKITGIDFFNVRQGVYSLEGIGRVKMYVSDTSRKLVLIKTDSITYGLTPENASQFVKELNTK